MNKLYNQIYDLRCRKGQEILFDVIAWLFRLGSYRASSGWDFKTRFGTIRSYYLWKWWENTTCRQPYPVSLRDWVRTFVCVVGEFIRDVWRFTRWAVGHIIHPGIGGM